jgi:hypothetical protein
MNFVGTNLGVTSFQSCERRSHNDRSVVALVIVLGQQVAHFHLDELEHLLVVNYINLVDEDNKALDADLARKKQVLPCLGHLTVSSGDHNDSTVHLSSTRDHIFDVYEACLAQVQVRAPAQLTISVARAINVTVVPCVSFVLNMRRVDCDSTGLLLRSTVDLRVVGELGGTLFRKDFRDSGGKSSLAMINVT